MRLSGKRALVTGAARGIGRGCAIELAREGADVALNDLERTAELEAVAAEIHALDRLAVVVNGDAFERTSCEKIFESAVEAFGGIDVLVSNPAHNRRAAFLDYSPEVFEKVLKGTLFGGFHMGQLAARNMVSRGVGGKIIFISSIHAKMPYANSVAYNAGKAGLNHLAGTMAAELSRYHINVNIIEPGWIDTPGEHEAFGEAFMREKGPTLPWGRFGTPRDIGRAAVFLASDDADYVTGTTLLVDGGLFLKDAHE